MRERLRTIVRPESAEAPHALHAREAVAVWLMGTAWAGATVALWRMGVRQLVPVTLMGAMLTLSAWRGRAWLQWFPVAAAIATLLDVATPVEAGEGVVAPRYAEIVAAAAALLVIARLVGRSPVRAWAPPRVRALLIGFVAVGVALVGAGADVRGSVMAIVAFGAAVALAARPAGSRRVWTAFPAIGGLVGVHALVALLRGGGALGAERRAADWAWGHVGSVLDVLLLAVPVSLAMAIDPSSRRRGWGWAGGVLGLFGVAVHLGYGGLSGFASPPRPGAFAAAAILLTLATFAAFGPRARWRGRRWVGLGITLVVAAGLVLVGQPLTGATVQVEVALAAGLAMGGRRDVRGLARRRLALVPGTAGPGGGHARTRGPSGVRATRLARRGDDAS